MQNEDFYFEVTLKLKYARIMNYEIVQKLTWNCRFIEVKRKNNRGNGSEFVLVKLGKYDTGDFLRSLILPVANYDKIYADFQKRGCHVIERFAIRPQNNVYHILQWDDIDRGVCSREKIGEVQRDSNGSPIAFSQIVIYANIDNQYRFSVDQVLEKEYIEVNSPLVQNYLNYNNRKTYLQQLEAERQQEQNDYEEWMSNLYDAYERNRYSDMDMSEEDMVMAALENGEGECYGY